MNEQKRFQIVFLSGYPPMVATLEPWFVDPDLKALLEQPPAQIPKQRDDDQPPWWTGIPADYSYGITYKGGDGDT